MKNIFHENKWDKIQKRKQKKAELKKEIEVEKTETKKPEKE